MTNDSRLTNHQADLGFCPCKSQNTTPDHITLLNCEHSYSSLNLDKIMLSNQFII